MNMLRKATGGALDHLGRLSGTDARYAIRGISWLSVAQFITSLGSLGLSIAFANLYPADAYGTYKYILSLAEIISAASLTGLSTALSSSSARGQDGAFIQASRLALLYSSISGFLMIAASGYYFWNENETLGWSLAILGVVLPFSNSVSTAFSFLMGKKLFKTRAVATIFQTSFYVGAMLLAISISDDPIVAILASSVGGLLGYAGVWLMTKSKIISNNTEDPKLHSYSKHLSLMNILGIVSSQIDKVLLFHYLGATQLALYSFAQAPVSQARQVSKILGNVALPKATTATLESQRKNSTRRAISALIIGIIIFCVYWVISPFAYEILFPSYTGAVGFSRWYALTLLALPVIIYKQPLFGHQKTKALYFVQTSQPIIKIALIVITVPLFGIAGAIGSVVFSELANVGLSAYAFNRVSKSKATEEYTEELSD